VVADDEVPDEAVAASEPAGPEEDARDTYTAAAEDEAAPPAAVVGEDVAVVERVAKPDETGAGEQQGVDPAAISGMLEQIFHDMEFECTVTVEAEEDGFLATVDGADKEALLEGNGRCLSALELLINNAFRHKLPRGNKVRVDAGDFRNRRDEELSDLAFQVAHSAKESGRTQETQPLNPYERRLVHLALAEDPAVTTQSRGTGFLKNVQVIPRGGGDGRSRGRRD
jgi:spoIIIJ-associated protein